MKGCGSFCFHAVECRGGKGLRALLHQHAADARFWKSVSGIVTDDCIVRANRLDLLSGNAALDVYVGCLLDAKLALRSVETPHDRVSVRRRIKYNTARRCISEQVVHGCRPVSAGTVEDHARCNEGHVAVDTGSVNSNCARWVIHKVDTAFEGFVVRVKRNGIAVERSVVNR